MKFDPGAFLILLSAFCAGIYFVLQKPYLRKYSALELTAYSIWAGTLFMLVFLPGLTQAVGKAPINATLAVIYLGVFPAALAYVTWTYVLSRFPASNAVSFLYLNPALAILVAWIWLGEIPTTPFSHGRNSCNFRGCACQHEREILISFLPSIVKLHAPAYRQAGA